jgi:hypothetical protein
LVEEGARGGGAVEIREGRRMTGDGGGDRRPSLLRAVVLEVSSIYSPPQMSQPAL